MAKKRTPSKRGTARRKQKATRKQARATRKPKVAARSKVHASPVQDAVQTERQRAFLEAFATGGNVAAAAKAAGVDRSSHYDWLAKDEAYKAAFLLAEEEAADKLELEARRRAVSGVAEPVFYKGVQIATVRKYSDRLLVFLLRGARPAKYVTEVTVKGKGKDGSIPVTTLEDIVVAAHGHGH